MGLLTPTNPLFRNQQLASPTLLPFWQPQQFQPQGGAAVGPPSPAQGQPSPATTGINAGDSMNNGMTGIGGAATGGWSSPYGNSAMPSVANGGFANTSPVSQALGYGSTGATVAGLLGLAAPGLGTGLGVAQTGLDAYNLSKSLPSGAPVTGYDVLQLGLNNSPLGLLGAGMTPDQIGMAKQANSLSQDNQAALNMQQDGLLGVSGTSPSPDRQDTRADDPFEIWDFPDLQPPDTGEVGPGPSSDPNASQGQSEHTSDKEAAAPGGNGPGPGPGDSEGSDAPSGGENGMSKGGIIKSVKGKNPPGPDQGNIPAQIGESVLNRHATAMLGPKGVGLLNALGQHAARRGLLNR